MGGFSVKCPLCELWFLSNGAMHEHTKAKHNVRLGETRTWRGPPANLQNLPRDKKP